MKLHRTKTYTLLLNSTVPSLKRGLSENSVFRHVEQVFTRDCRCSGKNGKETILAARHLAARSFEMAGDKKAFFAIVPAFIYGERVFAASDDIELASTWVCSFKSLGKSYLTNCLGLKSNDVCHSDSPLSAAVRFRVTSNPCLGNKRDHIRRYRYTLQKAR